MAKTILVPLLISLSAAMMAFAWIGHLRFHKSWTFLMALTFSWLIVLPEYVLNVFATRWGKGTYSGAQMASFHLSAGVLCVALVSRYVLGERLQPQQMLGFVLMGISVVLVTWRA